MTKLEMVQIALKVTGSSGSEDVAAFIERKFGVTIETKYIPLYRASLLGRSLVTSAPRRDAAAVSGQPLPQMA